MACLAFTVTAYGQAPTAAFLPVTTATQGLSLSQLLTEALTYNRQIRIERARIDEAQAMYRYAAAQAYPRLSARALFGGPTPEAQTTVINDISTLTPASIQNDLDFGEFGVTLRVEADAALPLYTFGKIAHGKRAGQKLVEAADENVHITEAEVATNIIKAYWTVQLIESFIASLADGRQQIERVMLKIEELLDNDSEQVTENDRLRLKYAVRTIDVRYTEAEGARKVAKTALCLLLGRPQDSGLELQTATLDIDTGKIPLLSELVKQSPHTRPELLALDALVGAHQEYAEYRRANFLPDIFLGGILRYNYTSNATDQTNPFIYDSFNFYDLGIGLGLRVELDIFSKLAELEQAEAKTRIKSREQEFAQDAVELEIRKFHIEIINNTERITKLDEANRTARSWLMATVLSYDIGIGEADELIDAFLAWATSEAELQKTKFDTIVGLAELSRASGRLLALIR